MVLLNGQDKMPIKFTIDHINNETIIYVPTSESFRSMISALKTIPGCKIVKASTINAFFSDDYRGVFTIDGI
jgi:hypothetical protein